MSAGTVTIGEFARMTHLSGKALRLYHEQGLLVPRDVDPHNGYRRYGLDQTATARLIRRFRALDMSLDEIRRILAADSADARNRLISTHLHRMERELARTRDAVASLRKMLEQPPIDVVVEQRRAPLVTVLGISDVIDADDLGMWWSAAFAELDRTLEELDWPASGPRGGLYATQLFEEGRGELTVYRPIPVGAVGPPMGRTAVTVLPAVDLAVAVHQGPDIDIDAVYTALGIYVAERGLSAIGPIRETYSVSEFDAPHGDAVTEIGWPISLMG